MATTFKSVSFQFKQGTVSWVLNKDKKQTHSVTGKPYMWTVYVGNNGKWYANCYPNLTQAKRFLRMYNNKEE